MIFDAEQSFSLPYPGPHEAALAFLRDPQRSLGRVTFLQNVRVSESIVRAEMLVQVPMMGTLTLPFESELILTNDGAHLTPRTLESQAWAEVGGSGAVQGTTLDYRFAFRVHVDMPTAEKWGGAAFEKMFHATARRTLERLAKEFPDGVRAAMP
ncbi:DUF3809 domain-containing protein [Deinococcus yavapaiensis]|uniref:Uncharacterized protein DUF3809 n=1 Tax=Deinococcus yavapaiensis KR-236 TaxID=694435 RepID=A0A318S1W5_9DEIO|nr:DUF3809 domain-containing protein [Deinococcus yavapaiensis]PYE48702.1 uncharacterized protein DUF3809 [Deinococcus yavapaiensis KR-236]